MKYTAALAIGLVSAVRMEHSDTWKLRSVKEHKTDSDVQNAFMTHSIEKAEEEAENKALFTHIRGRFPPTAGPLARPYPGSQGGPSTRSGLVSGLVGGYSSLYSPGSAPRQSPGRE